ncbi:hypothetical protein VT84_16665 [Gemmata sp. SH-PL17]|nr:hypothetical protein VT84_16665 [Gemmata sp. SH-PL17]
MGESFFLGGGAEFAPGRQKTEDVFDRINGIYKIENPVDPVDPVKSLFSLAQAINALMTFAFSTPTSFWSSPWYR